MSDSFFTKSRNALSISIFAFVLVFAASLSLSYVFHEQHTKSERAKSLSLLSTYAYHLEHTLDHSLSSNYTFASLVREFGGFTRWFPAVAASLHDIYPQVNNFALSPDGIVSKVYPLEGNEGVLGFNQLTDAEQGEEAQKALIKKEMLLSGPVELVQGGAGVVARLPIYLIDRWGGKDKFWGFSSTVIKLDTLLNSVNLDDLYQQGLSYQLLRTDTTKPMMISQKGAEVLHDPVTVELDLPSVSWTLQAEPVDGWLPIRYLGAYVLCSLLVAVVVARFVFLAYRMSDQRSQLAYLLSERTQEAHQTAQRLMSTLQAIPDPMIEISEQGLVLDVHVPNDELEVKRCFDIGAPYAKHLSSEASEVFGAALAQARETMSHRGSIFSVLIAQKTYWFEMSVVCNQVEQHQDVSSFVVLLRDITVRQDAEEQLRIAATAFETQDGILISNKDNCIIRVNKAFERISGYAEEEVLGRPPSVLSSGRHTAEIYVEMYERLRKEGSWEGEIWNRRKNGQIYPEWLSISTVRDKDQQVSHYVATFKDISESKASERKIRQLNYYDSLTRLANRSLLIEEMTELLKDNGLAGRQSAVMFIDLDHFKDINDVWGHKVGDHLLQEAASRLNQNTRQQDTVARFGGDEFLILLQDVDVSLNLDRAAYRASHVADRIFKAFEQPFQLEGVDYQVSISIGIAIMDEHVIDPLDIIKQSELAMYEAKAAGRSQLCFFKNSMQERVFERVQLEGDLRHAIDNNELILHVQPQWSVDKKIIGAEALLRWQHPDRGLVSPATFIPIAEETRLILPIGNWVLRMACQWLSDWQSNQAMETFVMSINVSAVQFSQDDFVSQVEQTLKEFDVPPNTLQLELTESMLAHDEGDIVRKMQALKSLGVLISLDDFGTGYSSLSYLHRLPIDQLKIDQSFVMNIERGTKNASLAESIISLGHSLGMEVIAEGVETSEQFDWLKDKGCDLFQGFGLARPMAIGDLLVLCESVNQQI